MTTIDRFHTIPVYVKCYNSPVVCWCAVQMGLTVVGTVLGIPLCIKGKSTAVDDQGPLDRSQVVEDTQTLHK